MKRKLSKKFIKKYLKFILLIVLIYLIAVPLLTILSTHFHETAHKRAYEKYGIEADYTLDPINYLYNFYKQTIKLKLYATGVTTISKEGKDKYLELEDHQKKEIAMAGVLSDLKVIYIASLIVLVSSGLLFFLKDKKFTFYVMLINLSMMLWIVSLVFMTFYNLTVSHGDLNYLLASIP